MHAKDRRRVPPTRHPPPLAQAYFTARRADSKHKESRMQNDQGQPVDLYIPRKCSWTNRLIGASDQASVQINVGTIDPNTGLHTGGSETYALSGYVRNKGESDMALTELVRKADETM